VADPPKRKPFTSKSFDRCQWQNIFPLPLFANHVIFSTTYTLLLAGNKRVCDSIYRPLIALRLNGHYNSMSIFDHMLKTIVPWQVVFNLVRPYLKRPIQKRCYPWFTFINFEKNPLKSCTVKVVFPLKETISGISQVHKMSN